MTLSVKSEFILATTSPSCVKISLSMTSTPPLTLSEFVKKELERKGWNRSELSRKSGLSTGTISNVLNDDRPAGVDVVRAMAVALGVPQHILFYYARLITELPGEIPVEVQETASALLKLPERDRQEIMDIVSVKVKRLGNADRDSGGKEKR